jgi:uroporphyrinogen-III synthase
VWVTRPRPGGERDAAAFARAGFAVIEAPVLSTRLVAAEVPGAVDWIVFVSANAVAGLAEACREAGRDPASLAPRTAAVGRKTAEAAREAGFAEALVPFVENAEGLLDAFAPFDLEEQRVLVPRGNREGSATGVLPERLGRAGATVVPLAVYAVEDRAPSADERAALGRVSPGATVIYSPSAADAVRAATRDDLAGWWDEATAVAVGPTTAARLEALDAPRVRVAERPDRDAVLDALRSVPGLREEESS